MNKSRPDAVWQLEIVLIVVIAVHLLFADTAQAAKNVILMIADGSGHNTWLAASLYQAKPARQAYDQPGWQRFACSTYPLNRSTRPTGDNLQDQSVIYDPLQAWNTAALNTKKPGFVGYDYLAATSTDSAAAATAMASGQKTYNSAINWSNGNRAMRGQTIAEIAKARGKSTGVVTTVPWSDATPAALGGAHNVTRNNHPEIANEMLRGGWLDVIMGGGNPDYDDDGQPLPANRTHDYQWVGGQQTWESLKQGRRSWTLIESKAAFEALIAGPTPSKLLGVAQIAKTLQEKRARAQGKPAEPFAVPFNRNVPSLVTMTKAAINCLDDNPEGFYLMIEGGAVDWANHANEPDRMIEEQVEFLKAVEAVVDWVSTKSNWNDTLLILTADHETGLLWGPQSNSVPFDPIRDNGQKRLPGLRYNTHGHSNSLVPLYAQGAGSERFAELVKGTDAKAAAVWQFSGRYLNNTDIFTVMKAELGK